MAVKTIFAGIAATVGTLGSIAHAQPAARQIAELNHLFATVDPLTARAIQESSFLRRFANFEVRSTTASDRSWTGRYLYGRETYIEFFAPDDRLVSGKPAPVGAWGIALSGDAVGFNKIITRRLEAAGHKAMSGVETRRFGDRDVPWFEALMAISGEGESAPSGSPAIIWTMEYQASYFDVPEAAKEAAEDEEDVISRERYLSDGYAKHAMRNIVEVHFDLGSDDFARLQPLLEAAGYRISRSADVVLADGNQTDLRFTLTTSRSPALRQVRFSLNTAPGEREETIGRSTLAVGPGTQAVWTFHAAAAE